jgi:hypothetical protein
MASLVTGPHSNVRFVWLGQGELLEEGHTAARRIGANLTFAGFRLTQLTSRHA